MNPRLTVLCSSVLLASIPRAAQSSGHQPPASTLLNWADFDRDGSRDVYALRPSSDDRLLRSLGDGAFEDVTSQAGLLGLDRSRSAAWGDFDGDRWPDLLVLSASGTVRLSRNLAGAAFEDRTADAGLADVQGALEARWVDYDQDGWLDLDLDGRFFHNRGDGSFEPARIAGSLATKATATPGTPGGGRLPLAPPQPSPGLVPSGALILAGSEAPLLDFTPTGESFTSDWISPWAPRASLSSGRVYSSAASLNGKIYVLGGHNGTSSLSLVEEYDPSTNAWTAKTSMPTARHLMGAAPLNGKIYAIGGNDSTTAIATAEEYDPATNAWATKASMPTARYGPSVTAVNGKIYAIGGINAAIFGTVEEYDPALDSWTTKASMPTARYGAGAAVASGKIYVIGGFGTGHLSTLEEYDPATNSWATRASSPAPSAYSGAVSLNQKLYNLCGQNAGGYLSSVEEYDVATNTWTAKASLSVARYGNCAAMLNGSVYVIGGFDGTSNLASVEAHVAAQLFVQQKN